MTEVASASVGIVPMPLAHDVEEGETVEVGRDVLGLSVKGVEPTVGVGVGVGVDADADAEMKLEEPATPVRGSSFAEGEDKGDEVAFEEKVAEKELEDNTIANSLEAEATIEPEATGAKDDAVTAITSEETVQPTIDGETRVVPPEASEVVVDDYEVCTYGTHLPETSAAPLPQSDSDLDGGEGVTVPERAIQPSTEVEPKTNDAEPTVGTTKAEEDSPELSSVDDVTVPAKKEDPIEAEGVTQAQAIEKPVQALSEETVEAKAPVKEEEPVKIGEIEDERAVDGPSKDELSTAAETENKPSLEVKAETGASKDVEGPSKEELINIEVVPPAAEGGEPVVVQEPIETEAVVMNDVKLTEAGDVGEATLAEAPATAEPAEAIEEELPEELSQAIQAAKSEEPHVEAVKTSTDAESGQVNSAGAEAPISENAHVVQESSSIVQAEESGPATEEPAEAVIAPTLEDSVVPQESDEKGEHVVELAKEEISEQPSAKTAEVEPEVHVVPAEEVSNKEAFVVLEEPAADGNTDVADEASVPPVVAVESVDVAASIAEGTSTGLQEEGDATEVHVEGDPSAPGVIVTKEVQVEEQAATSSDVSEGIEQVSGAVEEPEIAQEHTDTHAEAEAETDVQIVGPDEEHPLEPAEAVGEIVQDAGLLDEPIPDVQVELPTPLSETLPLESEEDEQETDVPFEHRLAEAIGIPAEEIAKLPAHSSLESNEVIASTFEEESTTPTESKVETVADETQGKEEILADEPKYSEALSESLHSEQPTIIETFKTETNAVPEDRSADAGAEVPERPKSPWAPSPSYSVTTQGSSPVHPPEEEQVAKELEVDPLEDVPQSTMEPVLETAPVPTEAIVPPSEATPLIDAQIPEPVTEGDVQTVLNEDDALTEEEEPQLSAHSSLESSEVIASTFEEESTTPTESKVETVADETQGKEEILADEPKYSEALAESLHSEQPAIIETFETETNTVPEDRSADAGATEEPERPKSPWAPSYSVTTQGSSPVHPPEEEQVAKELEVDPLEDVPQSTMEPVLETAPVPTEAIVPPLEATPLNDAQIPEPVTEGDVQTVLKEDDALTEEEEPLVDVAPAATLSVDTGVKEVPERPKSPWTPSYTVTMQGPGTPEPEELVLNTDPGLAGAVEEKGEVIQVTPPADDVSVSAQEIERPKSPYPPSYSVTQMGPGIGEENGIKNEAEEAGSVVSSNDPEAPSTPRSELGAITPSFDSRSEVSEASDAPIPPSSPRFDPEVTSQEVKTPLALGAEDHGIPISPLHTPLSSADKTLEEDSNGEPEVAEPLTEFAVSGFNGDRNANHSTATGSWIKATDNERDTQVPESEALLSEDGADETVIQSPELSKETKPSVTTIPKLDITAAPPIAQPVIVTNSLSTDSAYTQMSDSLSPSQETGTNVTTPDVDTFSISKGDTFVGSDVESIEPLDEETVSHFSDRTRTPTGPEAGAKPLGVAHTLAMRSFPSAFSNNGADNLSSADQPKQAPAVESLEVNDQLSPLSSRRRLESTVSSLAFPGGWVSTPPQKERPSLEFATGEFSRPIIDGTPVSPAVTPAAIAEASPEKESKWRCIIM